MNATLYCPECGAVVTDSKVGLDVDGDGKVLVSTPMLYPCEHVVKPVTMGHPAVDIVELQAIVNDARKTVIKSRSENVTVNRDTLAALVSELQGMLDTATNAKQAFPDPPMPSIDPRNAPVE